MNDLEGDKPREVSVVEKFSESFSRAASKTTEFAGSRWAFMSASLSIVVWLACGPASHYSDSWQLYANTGTTIITYLMVFLIQHTQNREGRVLQLKLDAVLRALENADHRVVGSEDLSEEQLEELSHDCKKLAAEIRKSVH